MRIIAGKLRGRQLVGFKARHIRPTTDRVKESIFNKLMGRLEGARVLDLFSGTGNLAIEAYSRGASYIQAVESHRQSLAIIDQNLKQLNIKDAIVVSGQDVFKFLKKYQGEPFDLVFADPPFTEKIAHEVMTELSTSSVCAPSSLVVIEASAHERVDDSYPGFKLLDRRDFGDKSVSFFEKEESDG